MFSGVSVRSRLGRTNNYRCFTISWFSICCSINSRDDLSDYIVNRETSSFFKDYLPFFTRKNKEASSI